MSEDPGAVAPTEDAAPAPASRRGRPRPQATVDRDEQVRKLLSEGPMTRAALAERLGWESKDVYASLWRLRNYESAVEKVQGKSEWQLSGATPAPPNE